MEFPRVINLDLLKNPLNWLTVFLMLVIFGLFANLVVGHYNQLSTAAGAPASSQ
jgi:hypothetical protein